MTQVTEPFPIFYDDDGTPLENGMIYVGEANQDPRTNPVAVFFDEALTVPAAQPIRTLDGRPAFQGAPTNLYISEAAYSITVQNRRGSPIVDAADVQSDFVTLNALAASGGSGLVGFIQAGTGAVARTAQDKLRDSVAVEDYGAVGDDSTDDTAAIQAMIDDVGYFRLLAKTYRITDSLVIPAHTTTLKSIGVMCSGEGMEKSFLNCVGMAGKAAIRSAGTAGLYRVSMRDFGINGDCDNCVNFTLSSPAQLYQSTFTNLWLNSDGGSAFVASESFSCTWINVQTFTEGGHGFDLEGGNSTVLIGCYAHSMGTGFAGYRIKGIATMIGCNGVDVPGKWGEFGASTALGDPTSIIFRITMIGCNIEDWDTDAIVFRNTGALTLEGCTFTAKSSGTFNSVILQNPTGAASSWKLIERNSIVQSKGATLSGASRIIVSANPAEIEVGNGCFTDLRRADQSLTYTIPIRTSSNSAFGTLGAKFTTLDFDRAYGFALQAPVTITANASTFDGTRRTVLQTANTVATNLDQVTGGTDGQILTLLIKDANTTIRHNIGGAGRFNNTSGANIVAASGDVYRYAWNSSIWKQV